MYSEENTLVAIGEKKAAHNIWMYETWTFPLEVMNWACWVRSVNFTQALVKSSAHTKAMENRSVINTEGTPMMYYSTSFCCPSVFTVWGVYLICFTKFANLPASIGAIEFWCLINVKVSGRKLEQKQWLAESRRTTTQFTCSAETAAAA